MPKIAKNLIFYPQSNLYNQRAKNRTTIMPNPGLRFLWPKQRLYIFSDNQAAVQFMGDPLTRRSGQSILKEIILAIDAVRSQGKSVEIHWILAHCGIDGKKQADIAAK